MKQKTVFLESEGDAWFQRNAQALSTRKLPDADPLLVEILQLEPAVSARTRVLEIGCGDGTRLGWLKENRGCSCAGVDPSSQAVETARTRGLDARQGTADELPFEDRSFDLVIFGFCLYLCDRDDLFRIAAEADRVLRSPGWLLIHDFYSPTPVKRAYHHHAGLYSHKMDYRRLFTWHPAYAEMLHKVRHHADGSYTDDPREWVATCVLRKQPEDDE